MLKFHSDKKNWVLTCHVPLQLLRDEDACPPPDEDELAFRRDLAARVAFPADGAGLAFAPLDDLDEPVSGDVIGHAAWHDASGLPLKPSLVDTSFPHSAYSHLPGRHAYVLLVDVWHPGLDEEERRALSLFQAKRRGAFGLKRPG